MFSEKVVLKIKRKYKFYFDKNGLKSEFKTKFQKEIYEKVAKEDFVNFKEILKKMKKVIKKLNKIKKASYMK